MSVLDESYLRDTVNQLDMIAGDIEGLIQDAGRLLKRDPITADVWERARGQWYANIASSIHPNTEWAGGSMVKMTDTIDKLREMLKEVSDYNRDGD